MFLVSFWKASAERALKTFAQTVVALVGTNAANLLTVGFLDSLKAGLVAAALSVLTSVASSKFGPNYGPSLTSEMTVIDDDDFFDRDHDH